MLVFTRLFNKNKVYREDINLDLRETFFKLYFIIIFVIILNNVLLNYDNDYSYILFLYSYTLFFILIHSIFYTHTLYLLYSYILSEMIR